MPQLRIRTKRLCFIVVLSICPLSIACRGPRDPGTVVVRVFRDSHSDFRWDLDSKLYSFNNFDRRLRVTSGKVVFVATVEGNYKEELSKLLLFKPQIIILDSSSDAQLMSGMQVNLTEARNACGSNGNCPAFIPPWVSGEELEATTKLFDSITRSTKIESPPDSGPTAR
jgi:hypothetical protein